MPSDLPRVVFLGSDAICLPALEYRAASPVCALHALVSQPDRPKGRGRKLGPNPAAAWAEEKGIHILKPEKPGRELADWMEEESIVLALVMAYGHFLGRCLREAPGHGMLNFHGSLLPRYRGASPVETAIACGERETGVCLMRVEAEMDAGAVAGCERVAIAETDSAPEIRARIGEAVVPLLERTLSTALRGGLDFIAQDHSDATFCRKLTKEDGWIDFSLDARAISDRVRGFVAWPGSFFEIGDDRIKVGRASVAGAELSPGVEPGTVLASDDGVTVATGGGTVRFENLQRPGGRMLPAREFLRGYPVAQGTVLRGGTARDLVSRRAGG